MTLVDIYRPDQWHDFFVMVGGGTAALTGLVFVAMSLNLRVIDQDATHRYRAIGTLTGFMAIFITCALVLMGGQNHKAVGVEWLVVAGVAGVIHVNGYVRAMRGGESSLGSDPIGFHFAQRVASKVEILLCPQVQHQVARVRPCRSRSLGTARGKLDGQRPHAPARTVDNHLLVSFEVGVNKECLPRRKRGRWNAAASTWDKDSGLVARFLASTATNSARATVGV